LTSREKYNEYMRNWKLKNKLKVEEYRKKYWAKKAREANVTIANDECKASSIIAATTKEELQRIVKEVDGSGVL
jgi:hypothetical protein